MFIVVINVERGARSARAPLFDVEPGGEEIQYGEMDQYECVSV